MLLTKHAHVERARASLHKAIKLQQLQTSERPLAETSDPDCFSQWIPVTYLVGPPSPCFVVWFLYRLASPWIPATEGNGISGYLKRPHSQPPHGPHGGHVACGNDQSALPFQKCPQAWQMFKTPSKYDQSALFAMSYLDPLKKC